MLYIRDHSNHEYTKEVKRHLEQLIGVKTAKDRSHLYLPPRSLPTVAKFEAIPPAKYFQVMYTAPDGGFDPGQSLVSWHSNYLTKHVFIHPAKNGHVLLPPGGREIKIDFNEHGGGVTTDELSKPNIDIFVDATKDNDRYRIDIQESANSPISKVRGKPYVRLFHELAHAKSMLLGLPNDEPFIVHQANQLRKLRGIRYVRVP